MKTIDEVLEKLEAPHERFQFELAFPLLAKLKEQSLKENDQQTAKQIWTIETVCSVHQGYWEQFVQLKAGEFYQCWCTLEQVELAIMRLRPHAVELWEQQKYYLPFIEEKVISLQSLFPYRVFMSPEILSEVKICNICKKEISIRNPCGHRVGEIYDGRCCGREITKSKIVGLSLVEDPVQRYSVPFLDDGNGKAIDHYNYHLPKYIAKCWPSPFHDWQVRKTTALHPKNRFPKIGRNDSCPCQSGDKYKHCCLRRDGIVRPHFEFQFNYDIPIELQSTEFSE